MSEDFNYDSKITQEWRPIPGWAGFYEINSFGLIRSIPRSVMRGNKPMRVRGGILSASGNPYLHVILSRPGLTKKVRVHVAVAEVFLGPRPKGLFVCHKNGKNKDNRLCNLEYGTPQKNQRDRVLHATDNLGSKNPMSKLDERSVLMIRNNYNRRTASEAAKAFSVSESAILQVLSRQRWGHLK